MLHSEDAMRPGAPAVWDEVPNNVPVETWFGDGEATDRAFAARRARRHEEFPHRPRHRRAARAARRARPLRRRDRPLHALCRLGRRGAAEERDLDHPRHSARHAARALARRRRQFRHAQPRVRRVRPGAVGGAQARPAGEIHRDALGSVPQRLPGPRSRHEGRAGARRRAPFPRHARHQHQQCRRALRVAVAAEQGLRPDPRLLRHSGGDAARHGGLHQHHADAGLSQLRPAGGDVRDRAAGRRRGRTARRRPHRAAAQEPGPAGRHAVPQRRRHALRQRPLRGEHGLGDGHRRLEGL